MMKQSRFFGHDWQSSMIFLLGSGLMLLMCGCAARESVEISGLRDDRSLQSESKGKNDLVTINSLFVSNIVALPQVVVDSVDGDGFYAKIVEAFAAEAGVDVLKEGLSVKKSQGTSPSVQSSIVKARQAGADAVLVTTISKYGKKQGSALGTSRAALLAAQFAIIRLSDNKEIWSSNYFSTEQPNSYNLLEVSRRFERDRGIEPPAFSVLAHEAAKRAALDFANRRTEQFTKR